jgi:exodeoxyribonuclease X
MDYTSWPKVIVADVEGNGDQPPDLVEVATVPIVNGRIEPEQAYSTLIRPKRPITWFATKVHGLTNQEVEACPAWEEVAEQVRGELGTAWLAGHNVGVDHRVLTDHLPGWQPAGVIDTLRLARAAYPDAPKHTLDASITLAGIDVTGIAGQRHRAGFDARATALLLLALAERYPTFTALTAAAAPKTGGNTSRIAAGPKTEDATLW